METNIMKHVIKRKAMPKILFIIGITLSLIFGTVYIYRTWEDTTPSSKNEAITLAESAAAFIEPERIVCFSKWIQRILILKHTN